MLYGVDVHPRYQQGFSFTTAKAQGYNFAATKATQGTHLTIADFPAWTDRARNAGLVPGAYHWIDNSASGQEQCRYFLRALQAVGGPEGLLIQLDCEDNATWSQVTSWVAEWKQLTNDHPFLVYTGKWWWDPRGWDGAKLTPYLWHSQYIAADLDTTPDDPAAFAARVPASFWAPNYGGWTTATFLQFTSKGDAGGLGNNVDLNATKLSMAELLALTTSRGSVMPAGLFRIKGRNEVWASDSQHRRHLPNPAAMADFKETFGNVPIAEVADEAALEAAAGPVAAASVPPAGGLTADDVRAIVREELDKTRLTG